jgi:uncharacterized repeat protein (TIGR03803 family)
VTNLVLSRRSLCVGAIILLAGCGSSGPTVALLGKPTARASATRVHGKIRTIYLFQGDPDGESPNSGIVAPTSVPPYPELVGVTRDGGYNGVGAVYGLTRKKNGKWKEATLYSMMGGYDGRGPNGIAIPGRLDGTQPAFVTSPDGGADQYGAVAVLRPNPSGSWKLLSVYSFTGSPDGAYPVGGVVADQSGNLYGATTYGGLYNEGTVYRLQPNGSSYKESVIYSFQSSGADGEAPDAGLTIDGENALYGTTTAGGVGYGTVFKLVTSQSGFIESILYRFHGQYLGQQDGSHPVASVCLGSSGLLYGTTSSGGSNGGGGGYGTAFRLTPVGAVGYSETVLWSFGKGKDGIAPDGSVIVGTDGTIYGTTVNGGSPSSGGTFFTLKRRPSGGSYVERVYSFNGRNDGSPAAGPTADANGNLFIPTDGGTPQHPNGAVVRGPIKVGALSCH